MRKGAVAEVIRTAGSALLLGILVWYISRNEITQEEEVWAEVQVVNAADCIIRGEGGGVPRVRVTLTGPILSLERVRNEIERRSLVARIRLAEERLNAGGRVAVRVRAADFGTIQDPRVRLTVPDRDLDLTITPLDTRSLPVGLDTDLDKTRYRAVIVPSTVQVRGPRAVLDGLSFVLTDPVNLRQAVEAGLEDVQQTVRIAAVQQGERIDCDERVFVHAFFEEETVEKTFPNVPVRVLASQEFPYKVGIAKAEHRTTAVTVRGPKSLLEGDPRIDEQIDVYLEVDRKEDNRWFFVPRETPYLIDRRFRLPEGVTLVSMTLPETVEVDIAERAAPTPAPPP